MAMKVYRSKEERIMRSIMDNDAYTWYMQQPIVHQYMDSEVDFKFLCRDGEDLRPYRVEIQNQINMMDGMEFTQDQLAYMEHQMPALKRGYVRGYLRMFRLFSSDVQISEVDGELSIRAKGNWATVMIWEMIVLAIVSEVRNRALYPDIDLDDVRKQLSHKVSDFYRMAEEENVDLSDLQIIDFGTRRRLSYETQFAVCDYLKHAMKDHFLGTSNVHIARELGLKAFGSQAHQWYQAHQAMPGVRLIDSQKAALQAWADEYRGQLSIALTDNICMDAFTEDFDKYFSVLYDGMRHDSGCPFVWARKAINHYKKLGIDPKTKTLVFSDGLKLGRKVLDIYKEFQGEIQMVFGIGTNLTCDVPGVKPMNIVMKIVKANGQHVAKLSDSPGKTMCESDEFVANLKQTFNYQVKAA